MCYYQSRFINVHNHAIVKIQRKSYDLIHWTWQKMRGLILQEVILSFAVSIITHEILNVNFS